MSTTSEQDHDDGDRESNGDFTTKTQMDGDQNTRPKRPTKLSEKGKAYRLTELTRQRNILKRKIVETIDRLQLLMGLHKGAKIVGKEAIDMNDLFKQFGTLDEEVQELLSEEERQLDCHVYEGLHDKICQVRKTVEKWIDQENETQSERSSVKTRSSKRTSTSSKSALAAKAIEAKAKHAGLKTKISLLEEVEAAEKQELLATEAVRKARKEAARVKLLVECAAAAAVSKIYDETETKDSDQELGSDDPDKSDEEELKDFRLQLPHGKSEHGLIMQDSSETGEFKALPAPTIKLSPGTGPDDLMTRPDGPERKPFYSPPTQSYPFAISTPHESKIDTGFWEKMELRMTQPPPSPTPFDGDSSHYLRFRANFRDQVEKKQSLTDSERMNYLMSYTTGRAREAIKNYEGLPNGCRLALQVLKERFGQNSMIIQALKSAVIIGPRIGPNDNTALMTLSDKVENCYWSMIELQSNELNCTTNLRHIYDRLPDALQRKWRKQAKHYRERAEGKEPTLKELSDFIRAEAQTENDPVYGSRDNVTHGQRIVHRNCHNKDRGKSSTAAGTRVTTLSTQLLVKNDKRVPRY